MGLPSTAFHRRGYVIEVLAAPLVFRHSMTKESECPRHRFSGLACVTAAQLNVPTDLIAVAQRVEASSTQAAFWPPGWTLVTSRQD